MDINQIKEEYVIKNLCREAKIMSKLNHPCIVALFQTMQRSDNVYYLVTELVSGGDLCSFVKGQHNGKLEERSTRMYARQFASALSHMHGLGVVHRDLKMENVMLNSSQSQIKIVDFGLSNSWSADNPLRTHCGSPEYAAPELFITGKQYGAEVDLWSLGIILYGMVMGQLPFMTSRASASTSQQRRKRLVAQINAGLATPHRRALAPFTPEFRSLMGRLLVADASRRIDARELTAHPWITERGRKVVRSNPLKEIDSSWRSKMIIEISTILQIDKKLVLSALSQDPLGKIGGMFNILQRKYQMSQLHGDGVTRSVPSVTLLELSDMTKGLGKGKAISTARTPAQKKPHTAAVGRRMDYFCTPRMVELDKHIRQVLSSPNEQVMRSKTSRTRPKPSDHHHHHHPAVAAPKQRPSTVQPTSSSPSPAAPRSRRCPPPDYRTLQSPSLRRKAYSAAVSSKAGGAASPPPPPRARDLAPAHQGAGDVALRGVAGGERCRHSRHATSSSPDDPQRRSSRPPPDRPRRRPGQSPGRPSSGPLQQLLERSLRTAGRDRPTAAAPPTPILSASFRAATRATPAEGQRRGGHEAAQAQSRRRGDGWDVPTARAVTVPYPTGRKSAIYDPIARSIADYVVNNVPHKLSNVPWRKK